MASLILAQSFQAYPGLQQPQKVDDEKRHLLEQGVDSPTNNTVKRLAYNEGIDALQEESLQQVIYPPSPPPPLQNIAYGAVLPRRYSSINLRETNGYSSISSKLLASRRSMVSLKRPELLLPSSASSPFRLDVVKWRDAGKKTKKHRRASLSSIISSVSTSSSSSSHQHQKKQRNQTLLHFISEDARGDNESCDESEMSVFIPHSHFTRHNAESYHPSLLPSDEAPTPPSSHLKPPLAAASGMAITSTPALLSSTTSHHALNHRASIESRLSVKRMSVTSSPTAASSSKLRRPSIDSTSTRDPTFRFSVASGSSSQLYYWDAAASGTNTNNAAADLGYQTEAIATGNNILGEELTQSSCDDILDQHACGISSCSSYPHPAHGQSVVIEDGYSSSSIPESSIYEIHLSYIPLFPWHFWALLAITILLYAATIPLINVLALVIYSKLKNSSTSTDISLRLISSTLLLVPDLVATLLAHPAAVFVDWYGRRVRLLVVCGGSLALLYLGFESSSSGVPGITLWLICIGIVYALFSSVRLP